jgi:hypothetical protein
MKLSMTALFSIFVGIIAAGTVVVVANKDESTMNVADVSDLIDGSMRKLRDTTISTFETAHQQGDTSRSLIADDDAVDSDRMLLRTTYDYGSMTGNEPTEEDDENQFRVRSSFDGERQLMSSKMDKKKMDKKMMMMSGKKGKDKGMSKMKMGMMKSSKYVGPDATSMKMMKTKKEMSTKKSKDGKKMKSDKSGKMKTMDGKSMKSKDGMTMKGMKKYDTD